MHRPIEFASSSSTRGNDARRERSRRLEYHFVMHVVSGTVVGGKIVVEGLSLPEGTVVTVLTPADDSVIKLPAHLEKELLDAIDEADQEVGGAGPEFLESLKRYG